MEQDNVKPYKAWFKTPLTMEEVGEKLVASGLISSSSYDIESVYEWIIGKTGNAQFEYNISRRHCRGDGFEDEPVHVLITYVDKEPDDNVINNAAQTISNALNTPVSVGTIDYHPGPDRYVYNQQQQAKPFKNGIKSRK